MTHGFAGWKSTMRQPSGLGSLPRAHERMVESPETCDRGASSARIRVSDGPVGTRTASRKGSWLAACALIVSILVPIASAVVANYVSSERNGPSDAELTANFLSHEVQFNEVEEMLTSDRRTLRLGSDKVIDLKSLTALLPRAERMGAYRSLLRQISVADLRYFPGSGEAILLLKPGERDTWGSSESYVYLPHDEPRPVVQHRSYYWRGPGLTFVTEDRRIRGHWFVHYNAAISLGFSPY